MKIRKLIIKIAVLLFVAIVAFYCGTQYAQTTIQPEPMGTDLETTTFIPMPSSSPATEPIPEPTPMPSPAPEKKLYKVTAYCPCIRCCVKSDGITASGIRAKEGVTVAAGKELAFDTQVRIEGIGLRTVQDRGGAIKEDCLDLFFESHKEALQFGVQWLLVEIVEK